MSETLGERLGTCDPEGDNNRHVPTEQEVFGLLVRACRAALAKIKDHEPGSVTMELLEAAVSTAERHRSEPRFTLEEIEQAVAMFIDSMNAAWSRSGTPVQITQNVATDFVRRRLQESRR